MENDPKPLPTKDEMIEQVIDVFIETIGFIERNEVSRTSNVLKDFKIIDDDLTAFFYILERQLKIKSTQSDWDKITEVTIENIADLMLECLSRPKPPEPPPPKGILARFLYWFRL
jgi:hypothetical protein